MLLVFAYCIRLIKNIYNERDGRCRKTWCAHFVASMRLAVCSSIHVDQNHREIMPAKGLTPQSVVLRLDNIFLALSSEKNRKLLLRVLLRSQYEDSGIQVTRESSRCHEN